MKVVAFDIETVPDYMGVNMKDYLYLKNRGQRERTEEEVERDISFNPFTLYVISVAMVEMDEGGIRRCKVVYASDEGEEEQGSPAWCDGYEVEWSPVRMRVVENELYDIENRILEAFWDFVRDASKLVSFNGYDFDGYVIRIRSMLHGIRPSTNLLRAGRDEEGHTDLLRLLSNYDRSKRLTLDFICRKFGIYVSKDRIDGSRVAEEFFKGNYRLIAEYNLKDALALAQLYLKVRDFLGLPAPRPPSENQVRKLAVLLRKIGDREFDQVVDLIANSHLTSQEVSGIISLLERIERNLPV
jgi:DNA polymerase III epsilon subunit-like protein